MSAINARVGAARTRLTLNVALDQAVRALLLAASAWGVVVIVCRIVPLGLPEWGVAGACAALGTALAAAGVLRRRVRRLDAAVEIDRAAGLKERISTAVACSGSADPFARAAVQDAERVAASIHVPTHIHLRAPRLVPWTAAAVASAALLYAFMPTINLFARDDPAPAAAVREAAQLRQEVNVALAEQIRRTEERTGQRPELAGLADELRQLQIPEEPGATPEDVRREVVKRIDNVNEKLNERLASVSKGSLDELKKQLAKLEKPAGNDAASKLASDLSRGDLSAAREAIADLKKQVEDLARKGDRAAAEKLAELSKKLEDLAAQLEKLQDNTKLAKELQNRGRMSEEQARKLLEQAAGMDPKQLEKELAKQLEKSGLSEQDIKDLAKKIAENQQAQQAMKQMAQCMAKAAANCKQCQSGGGQGAAAAAGAMAALGEAAGQLSDLETAEQMAQELQAQLAELGKLKESACQGGPGPRRDPNWDQIGRQGGNEGLGYGSRIGKDPVAHAMEPTQVKGKSQGGQIIGQMLMDAPMIRGEAQAAVYDAVNAAVRDATDAIEREEVPRQYEHMLRLYFERLAGLAKSHATTQNSQ
ncbi:MAG: hypothetical protein HRF50_05165 [Phycisphaerae bacterium]